jgi:hypothetical protein
LVSLPPPPLQSVVNIKRPPIDCFWEKSAKIRKTSDTTMFSTEPHREWTFTVRGWTRPGEVVCLTGNCAALGNWKSSGVVKMTMVENDSDAEPMDMSQAFQNDKDR